MRLLPEKDATVFRRPSLNAVFELMLVFCAGLVAVIFATWPLAANATTHAPNDLGDPLLNAYVLGWGGHAVIRNPLRIFDATFFDPVGLSFALVENMLGFSLPLAPLLWTSDNALLVANVAMLLYPAIAGVGTYLVIRQLTGSRSAASVCALAYAVMPVRLAQASHLHVYGVYALPFVLLCLVRLAEPRGDRRATLRRMFGLAVVSAVGIWASLTGAVLMGLVVTAWTGWVLLRRPVQWAVLGRAFVGLGVGVVLSLPVIAPYVALRDRFPDYRHPEQVARTLSATPSSYLSPPPGGVVVRGAYEALSRRYRSDVGPAEKHLFPGIWLSVAAAAAAVFWLLKRRGPGVPALGALVALVGFVFSLGPRYGGEEDGIPLPFLLVEKIGGITRVPSRMGAVVPLGLLILVGWAIAQAPIRWRRILVGASLVAISLEMAPTSVPTVRAPAMTSAHHAVEDRGGVVLGLPTTEFDASGAVRGETVPTDTRHLYLSTANFRRIVNGYGSYHPPSYWEVVTAVQDFPSPVAWEVFERRDIRTVVVQTDLLPGTRWADVVPKLDATPGVRLVGTGAGVRVYDVTQAAGTAPA